MSALVSVSLWSTNALTADFVLARTHVAVLLAIEASAAAMTLAATRTGRMRRERPRRLDRHRSAGPSDTAKRLLLAGTGLTGTMTLQYLAYSTAPIVAANALTYIWPWAAAGWFALRIRDRRSIRQAAMAGAAFIGVLVTIAGTAEGSNGTHPVFGLACAIGSAACMALFTVGSDGRSVSQSLLPAALTAMAVGIVWSLVTHEQVPPISVWVVAAAMGVGQMACGYLLWAHAMTSGGSRHLAGLGYLTPMLSTILLLATGARATMPVVLGVLAILLSSFGILVDNRVGELARKAQTAMPSVSPTCARTTPH